jgi:hypothetical protein
MTRMLATLVPVALLVLSPVLAQDKNTVVGSGRTVTETRELAEFDTVELCISGDAYITIGKPTPLEITADDNLLPLIETEVQERRLVISTEYNFKTKHSPDFKITVANLTAATVGGSGDMEICGVDNEKLALNVAGSGDLCFEGKTDVLAVSIAGSGDVRLTGKAGQFTASIAGSGDLHGFGLAADSATVSVKGSGDARVNVTGALTVQIFGSGDVHYKGNPTVCQQIAGSGDVKRRD